jgi:outer membrane protein assembly factor BamB
LSSFSGCSENKGQESQSAFEKQAKSAAYSKNTGEVNPSSHEGTLKWNFYADGTIEYHPAIGLDGTIYFCSLTDSQYILYALNPDGTKKWEFSDYAGGTWSAIGSSPCIGSDGTLYFGLKRRFYAFNPGGTLKWEFNTVDNIFSSPGIGLDGTIYLFSRSGNILALRPDGSLKWEFPVENYLSGYRTSSLSIGSNGMIYFSCPNDARFYALTPLGIKKWDFVVRGRVYYSPAIDLDETLYFGLNSGDFYALNPDGTKKWEFLSFYDPSFSGVDVFSPSIGSDRTVYFGHRNKFYALNPDGTLKWEFNTGDNIYTSPAIDTDGIIYFGCDDGKLYALNPDGTIKWEFATGGNIRSSPAIDSDGTIYFGSNDGYFYALNTDSLGLANAPWPKYQYGNQNTGSVQSSEYYAPVGELEMPDEAKLYYDNEIEVSGWALSLAGILKVEIYIDDVYQGEAELGITRDDIYQRFPDYDSRYSGFRWTWDIQSVPRGKYMIEAVAFDALGMQESLGERQAIIFKW